MVNQVVNPTKQDQRDIEGCLLLTLKSRNDTVSANPYCQMLQKPLPQPWTNVRVNSVMALSCCKSSPQSSGPSECQGMGGAWTSCTEPELTAMWFSNLWSINESPQRLYTEGDTLPVTRCYVASGKIWNEKTYFNHFPHKSQNTMLQKCLKVMSCLFTKTYH